MTINLIEHDQSERQLALDASKSFIVQAPAGSGKTTLLIQRFLTLLNHVKHPEEVLAITFTKKAANEMRLRIISALKQALHETKPASIHDEKTWLLAKQVLQRDQQYHWNLIDNPNQLRIQTIDSLCSYLTKQLPILSHFGSQPDITDTATLLYQEAVQEVLSHIEEKLPWSNAIAELLLHLDNDLNKLHDLLINLLAKRDQWLPYLHFEADDAAIKKQLEHNLVCVITDALESIHTLFSKDIISELCAIARFAANNLHLSQSKSTILACRDLCVLPGSQPEYCEAWQGLARLLLTENNHWRKQFNVSIGFPAPSTAKNSHEKILFTEYKVRALQLITQLKEREDIRTALSELTYLPAANYQGSQWSILQALLLVLKITAAQLRVVFQQHGQIDFIENTQAAITALGNKDSPTDLALILDYQIKHILVDEFQDTSFTQFQLIEMLTRGWEENDARTIFIVGDPMQSIYRFREAEVGLFIHMRSHGIGHIKLIPLTLTVNFRSSPGIVEWTNYHFDKIFPKTNNIATGAVMYSHSVSGHESHSIQTPTITGLIDIDSMTQASKIIAIIDHCKLANPNEKIAILVRARQHLKKIIPALKKAKIPYRAVEIDPLTERQMIQDLLSLTSAMLHPANRIAWLSILRAPWCGLSLADLVIIAGDSPHAAIYEQLEREDLLKVLSKDGQERISRIFPILKSQIAERERSDIRSWIENTWIALGGPACLQDISEIDDVNMFFKLLEGFAQEAEPLSLKKLYIKIEKLFAAPQHDDSALQIMTIHSAKGLEFDTVILPHLERKNAIDNNPLLVWMEYPVSNEQIALLLAPVHATGDDKDPIYNYIYRQQQIKSDYETNRLLYVATTRAKRNLHLLFNTSKKEDGTYAVESGSFLEKLWPLIENQTDNVIETECQMVSSNHSNVSHRYITRIDSEWENPIIYTNITIASHLKSDGFKLTDSQPKIIGIVIHRLLQQMANLGINWWQDTNHDNQLHYLKMHLSQFGLAPHELEPSASHINHVIQNVLHDPRGLWTLQSHQEAKSEFAISALIDNAVVDLVLDRTFIDDKGTRWIIDYKSAMLEHQDIESFLSKEQEKYRDKMNQYAHAMRLIEDKPIRLGLYFPVIPAWKEWCA